MKHIIACTSAVALQRRWESVMHRDQVEKLICLGDIGVALAPMLHRIRPRPVPSGRMLLERFGWAGSGQAIICYGFNYCSCDDGR